MSRSASIELDWADGTFTFRLAWGELAKLQEACDAGPYVIHLRLQDGSWRVEDIASIIRLGLIGGGMAPAEALKKVRAYVEDRPPAESLPYAQTILTAGLIGAPEEKLKPKAKGGERLDDLPRGKIRFSSLYGNGAVMGFTPQQVNEMSVFEFMSAALGYEKAHSNDDSLTDAEQDDLWIWIQGAA